MTNFLLSELQENMIVAKLNAIEDEIKQLRSVQKSLEQMLDESEPIPEYGWFKFE